MNTNRYIGRFNKYKVGEKIAIGMKEAKFFQRGYSLFGKEYKIVKLNQNVRLYHSNESGFFVK